MCCGDLVAVVVQELQERVRGPRPSEQLTDNARSRPAVYAVAPTLDRVQGIHQVELQRLRTHQGKSENQK